MRRTSAIGSGGFTLLELVVVLAIMVLASAAFPLFFSERAMQARRTAAGVQRLMAALQEAESAAVLYALPARLDCKDQVLTARFSSRTGDTKTLSYPIEAPIATGTGGASPNGLITLFPDGSASGGRFLVGTSPRQRAVSISSLTGRIRVEGTL